MLRVSVIDSADAVTIKLEGKLVGPWCEEVARVCAAAANGSPLRLDLYDVTYADEAGTELIRAMLSRGVATLDRCSSFLAELLKPEGTI